jgi:cytochrome c oxidase cbb3-type subunit IV
MSVYEFWQSLVAEWGFVYFGAFTVGTLVYALWPAKKSEFDHAARLPLDED